jgi:NAD dependent epimerase/dehydratase family enzyme
MSSPRPIFPVRQRNHAPEPVTNAVFTATLADVLHRPALLPMPAWPLHKVLGDFAQKLLLSRQRVLPKAALDSGFAFDHPTLRGVLEDFVNGEE